MKQVLTRSRPRGAGPGSQGQASSNETAANPKRSVTMLPLGTAFTKSLQFRMGNMHGPKYMPRLFEHWKQGQIDPAFVFSHRLPLELAPQAYKMFRDKEDECIKIILQP